MVDDSAPVQSVNLPSESHGIWHAQLFDSSGKPVSSSVWVLSIFQSPSYPSAFGAVKPDSPESLPRVLHGSWSAVSNVISISEVDIPGGDPDSPPHRKFRASLLSPSDDSLVMRGSWISPSTGTSGVLIAVHESEEPVSPSDMTTSPICGLWIGKSEPRPDLRELVPTNPIRWALGLLRSTREAFGAGFFDDSADVPGRPVLLFSIRGDPPPPSSGDDPAIRLTKVYEQCAGGFSSAVSYSARLLLKEDGKTWALSGEWRNPGAGTDGSFDCSRVCSGTTASIGTAAAVATCEMCGRPILPGETRWTCRTCVPLWSCCAACKCSSAGDSAHSHPLEPDVTHKIEFARGDTCARLARDSFVRFGARPFLGRRPERGSEFVWFTYSEIGSRVRSFSAALRSLVAASPSPPRFLLLADISVDYTVAILGALDACHILVPVHTELDVESLANVLSATTPVACFVTSPAAIARLHAAEDLSGIGSKVVVISDVSAMCSSAASLPDVPPGDQDLSSIGAVLFTSGTTSRPKGAAFTQELMMPAEGVAMQPFVRLDFQSFDPSFVLSVLSTVHCGGQRAFSSVDCVWDDMRDVRPTHLGAPPAFWHALYRDFVLRASQLCKEKRVALAEAEEQATREVRASLGNRLAVATSGGAPLSQEVCQFVRSRLRVGLVDLFGTRETGGIARDGVVHAGVDVFLLPVPELGLEGDPQAGPAAREVGRKYRGEVCVFSPRIIPGYWQDGKPVRPEASWVSVAGKSFYRTGDIAEVILEASGRRLLHVIDRRAGQTKLAQGEWLAPARVESTLEECPAVRQALVMGKSDKAFPVCVVVPSPDVLRELGAAGADRTAVQRRLLSELRLWCAHRQLRPFEIPQALFIETEPWTQENAMLTSTEKKRREALCNRYQSVRDELYSLQPSAEPVAATVSDELLGMLKEALSLPSGISGLTPDSTLGEIGGDSVAAARLVRMLRRRDVDVPMASLFQFTIGHLSALLSARTFIPTDLRAAPSSTDWAGECTLPAGLGKPRQRAPGEPHDVLLTGATGFIGPLLVAELLSQCDQNTTVHCLVRAPNAAAGLERVVAGMIRAGVWKEEQRKRISAVAGDVSLDHFGLKAEQFAWLAQRTSVVIHSAARVSFNLPYSALRLPNVVGTVNVIAFALEAGAVVRFVSSVGALCAGDSSVEQWPVAPAERIGESTSAYGQTKAVSERLLNAAREKLGLDVAVLRPSDVSGSTSTGFSNELDFSVLSLRAFAVLGCAPEAAMQRDLCWIPVDFVARAIVALSFSEQAFSRQRVFHLNGGGPLLSAVTDELRSALSVPIPAVPAARWQEAIEALPPEDGKLGALRTALLAMSHPGQPATSLSNKTTKARLSEIGCSWPDQPSSAYIRRTIEYLASRKFFEK